MKIIEKLKNSKHFQKVKPHLEKFNKLDKKLRIVLIVLLVLILLGIPSIAYMNTKNNSENIEAGEMEKITTQEPSEALEETTIPTQYLTKVTPIKVPSVSPVKSQAPSISPTPTSAPAQTKDTTSPTLDFLAGPGDGSTVSSATFCFPMKATDNLTSSDNIQTRFRFDSSSFGDWGNNLAPCYYNVANGSHNYVLEFRDQAGNVGSSVSRTFTVQVN